MVGGTGIVGYVVDCWGLGKGDRSITGFCTDRRRLVQVLDEKRMKARVVVDIFVVP